MGRDDGINGDCVKRGGKERESSGKIELMAEGISDVGEKELLNASFGARPSKLYRGMLTTSIVSSFTLTLLLFLAASLYGDVAKLSNKTSPSFPTQHELTEAQNFGSELDTERNKSGQMQEELSGEQRIENVSEQSITPVGPDTGEAQYSNGSEYQQTEPEQAGPDQVVQETGDMSEEKATVEGPRADDMRVISGDAYIRDLRGELRGELQVVNPAIDDSASEKFIMNWNFWEQMMRSRMYFSKFLFTMAKADPTRHVVEHNFGPATHLEGGASTSHVPMSDLLNMSVLNEFAPVVPRNDWLVKTGGVIDAIFLLCYNKQRYPYYEYNGAVKARGGKLRVNITATKLPDVELMLENFPATNREKVHIFIVDSALFDLNQDGWEEAIKNVFGNYRSVLLDSFNYRLELVFGPPNKFRNAYKQVNGRTVVHASHNRALWLLTSLAFPSSPCTKPLLCV